MKTLLVAYDIADPARLRRVAHLLEDYGMRLQRSVFVCNLSSDDVDDLLEQARDMIDPAVDYLMVMPMCGQCVDAVEQFGQSKALPDANTGYIA